MLKNMMSEDEISNKDVGGNKKLPVYVNQWRYRSVKALIHNGDFYFNTVSLTSDKLIA